MMKHPKVVTVSAYVIALSLFSGITFAQAAKTDLGKREFDANCASCHGANGKGQGQMAEWLQRSPTDLSTLTKRNGGVFPVNRMYETIEGANVPSHGTRDMPVWGTAYRLRAGEYYQDAPYDAEAYARTRILALIEYISRLQER